MADTAESVGPRVYEFEGYRLDSGRRLLLDSGGQPVELSTKSFDTLIYFLEHPGVVIDRGTLLAAVWPRTVVEENNLSQAVAALRRALGARCILTVPRQGYQFVLDVRSISGQLDSPRIAALQREALGATGRASHARRMTIWSAAVVAVVVVGGVIAVIASGPSGQSNRQIDASIELATPATGASAATPGIETLPTDSFPAYARFVAAREASLSAAPDALELQLSELDEAIRLDPEFALAYALRASARLAKARLAVELGQVAVDEHLQRARLDAERAVELAPELGEGHAILAATSVFTGDLGELRNGLKTALELSPDNRLVITMGALYSLLAGQDDDARQLFERSARFDPQGFNDHFFYLAGDVGRAAEWASDIVLQHPAQVYPRTRLALYQTLLGNREDAERELRLVEAMADRGDPDPAILAVLVYAYGRIGLERDAHDVFAKLVTATPDPGQLHAAHWINAYLGLGDIERALEWAERAAEDPFPLVPGPQLEFMLNTLNDPRLDRPQFVALRHRPELDELHRLPGILD